MIFHSTWKALHLKVIELMIGYEDWPNKAIKFAPFGRRTLSSSRRLWRR